MFTSPHIAPWRPAIIWGVSAALLHRIGLTIWMNFAWLFLGQSFAAGPNIIHDNAYMPPLTTPLEQHLFGIWRRWDGMHYIALAEHGYQPEIEGSTVFGAFTPVGIRLFDLLLPGPLDLGAMVFETLMFALALIVLYRLVETYYADPALAPWAVIVLTLTPLSFYFAAPMSESPYLALALAAFYCGARQRWTWAAVFAFLATMARSQGMVLVPVLGLLLLEHEWRTYSNLQTTLWMAVRKGWPLAMVPLAYIGFELYRNSMGLQPVSEIYRTVTQNRVVIPIEGLILNLGVFVRYLREGIYNLNPPWLVLTLGLMAASLYSPKHRRIGLQAYTFGHMALFLSFINYVWYTDEIMGTQSIARYTLILFPLAVVLADGIRRLSPRMRALALAGMTTGLLAFSALFLVALVGP